MVRNASIMDRAADEPRPRRESRRKLRSRCAGAARREVHVQVAGYGRGLDERAIVERQWHAASRKPARPAVSSRTRSTASSSPPASRPQRGCRDVRAWRRYGRRAHTVQQLGGDIRCRDQHRQRHHLHAGLPLPPPQTSLIRARRRTEFRHCRALRRFGGRGSAAEMLAIGRHRRSRTRMERWRTTGCALLARGDDRFRRGRSTSQHRR